MSSLFHFDFTPIPSSSQRSPIFSARGLMTLTIDGVLVWGSEENGQKVGVDGHWDAFLWHLATCWRYLIAEESDPMGLIPEEPRTLLQRMENHPHWRDWSEEAQDEMDDTMVSFLNRHDLAQGLDGIGLKPVILWRRGTFMRIEINEEQIIDLKFDTVYQELKRIGNLLSQQIAENSERGKIILADWQQREELTYNEKIVLWSSISEQRCKNLPSLIRKEKNIPLESPPRLAHAARMMHHAIQNDMELDKALQRIQDISLTKVGPQLDQDTKAVQRFIKKENIDQLEPHKQGIKVAQWLRKKHQTSIKNANRCERIILENLWQISIQRSRELPEEIDAIACWEKERAIILLNTIHSGQHPNRRQTAGQRTSLAHEMAHLLLDREQALVGIEVLGKNMALPYSIERRANAFAAEFLLPQAEAFSIAKQHKKDIKRAVNKLVELFGVSGELAAWQINKSASELQLSLAQCNQLRRLVHSSKDQKRICPEHWN
ncbi:ImmA/IrrE family metallo-endopeptidase [Magnetococcales bacterium HHB-1]